MTKPSIVAVLSHYGFGGLYEEGGWRAVKCMFHGDRRASASYNPDEGVFVCHACDIKGDAYAVVMSQEGISFAEAKSRVQGIAGGDDRELPGGSLVGRSRLPLWARERVLARKGDRSGGGRLVSSRPGGRKS